jgi:hypothetical protein
MLHVDERLFYVHALSLLIIWIRWRKNVVCTTRVKSIASLGYTLYDNHSQGGIVALPDAQIAIFSVCKLLLLPHEKNRG